MKYKLIAADIDGTLLNPHRELTERTVKAVQAVMAEGAYFVLSSGRMPPALLGIAKELKVNAPAVCYNGGALVDVLNNKTLFSTPVPIDLAVAVAKECESMGLYLHAFVHGGYIAPEFNALTKDYQKLCGVKAEVVNGKISEHIDEAPMKLLVLNTPEGAAKALPLLKEKFGDRANLMHSQKHMIECVDKRTSKAGALEFLRNTLGIDVSETCAFGDGQNDLDMLRWAGKAFVMDNAPDTVKNASPDFTIVPSNAEDGVAQTLERLWEE